MYLGIDYGQKRIGLAIGSHIPRGIGTLANPGSFEIIIDKISVLCKDNEIEKIIIGMPKKPSGDESELSAEVESFAKSVSKKTGLEVIFEEESYTSVQAEEELRARGIDVRSNPEKIDELSAVFILEQYINEMEKLSKNS